MPKARRSALSRRWLHAVAVVLFAVLSAVAVIAAAVALTAGAPHAADRASYPTLAAAKTPPVAAFIGGSYAAGSGASEAGKRWTTLVSASQKWQESNLAKGGTGYLTTAGPSGCGRAVCPNFEQTVSQVVAANPNVVVVAGGQSDDSLGEERVKQAIESVFHELRKGLPTAQIIAVGPLAAQGKTSQGMLALDEDVRSAAAAVGAVFVDLLNPPVVTPKLLSTDHGRVGDAVHAAIAARVIAAVKNS